MDFFHQAAAQAFLLIITLDREVFFIAFVSLSISLSAAVMASCLAVPAGVWFVICNIPGKQFIQGLLNFLMALPTVIIGLFLYAMLSRSGPLGEWDLLYTRTAIVIGQFILLLPIICNLSIAVIRGADQRIDLTCRLLGATLLQRTMMLLSEMRYGLLAAVIAGFGRAISEVGIAMLVGGNIKGATRTLTTSIMMDTSRGELELAFALGFLLLLTAFFVSFTLQILQRRKAE